MSTKTRKKEQLRDDTARIVADIHEVSVSLVKKVRNGDRENEAILETCIEYQQGKSKLIQHLKDIVRFDKPQKSRRSNDQN